MDSNSVFVGIWMYWRDIIFEDVRRRCMVRNRPEYDKRTIGENLRRCRIAKNLSIEEVRKYLQIGSQQAIYKWEEGKCYPQADNLLALMELYEVGLKEIVYDGSDNQMLTLTGFLREMLPASDYMICLENIGVVLFVVKFRYWRLCDRVIGYCLSFSPIANC